MTEENRIIPLHCNGCGKDWDHRICGCEPEGAERMETDICASCNDRKQPRNAIVTYRDANGTKLETSEFSGQRGRSKEHTHERKETP